MSLQNTKLIQLIKTMSPKEWKSLETYLLQNSEANSRDHRLYKELNKHFPGLSEHDIDGQKLLTTVFGKNETDDRKIRRSMNRLLGVAERLLTSIAFDKQVLFPNLLMLREFGNRDLAVHYKGQSQKIRKRLESEPRDTTWYDANYQLELDAAEFEERTTGRKAESRTQAISDKLDARYAVHRLKLACAIFTRQRLYDVEYDQGLLEPLLERLRLHPPTSVLVRLYYRSVLMMMHEDDQEQFQMLRSELEELGDQVSRSELMELHIIAQNHCIREINKGQSDHVKHLFELYKLGLEQDIIQTDPIQFAPAFKNIDSVAIRLKEFRWAKWFIDNHASQLGKNERDYMRYNLALLHFAQDEFLECRKYIHKELFSDTFIKMNVRILLLKTYYELEQTDLLEAELDNFKQFLHRNKQLGYHRKNCLGMIRSVRSLINLKPGDEKSSAKLKTRIGNEEFLAERKWLLSKL